MFSITNIKNHGNGYYDANIWLNGRIVSNGLFLENGPSAFYLVSDENEILDDVQIETIEYVMAETMFG
jgi:hypothetical protein